MRILGARAALALAAVAIVAGALAAWMVQRELASAAGASPSTPVLAAAATIEAGTRIEADSAAGLVETIEVPVEFAPPDALSDASEVAGLRAVAEIPLGGYLTRGAFTGSRDGGRFRLRRGERAISVDATPAPDGKDPAPGSIVDLLSSGLGGAQDTRVLIAGAEVLEVSEADSAPRETDEQAGRPTMPEVRLTIRVAAGQLPAVVRADVFARELRAVVR